CPGCTAHASRPPRTPRPRRPAGRSKPSSARPGRQARGTAGAGSPATAGRSGHPGRSSSYRVALQHRPERPLEGFEMSFVVAPLLQPFLVNGPPDLLRARRADGTILLVKAQNLRLEGKAAVLEQRAYGPLAVGHHLLVLDTVDAARQDRVPVIHQPQVIAVIVSEIREVVGPGLPVGEQLLEAGKAARHRVPARVDDLRVRQNQVDQP